MFYQLSYIKKHVSADIRQNFLPRTFVKFNTYFVCNLQTCKTDTFPKNDCNFTYRRPNLINGIANKTYRPIELKEIKKLLIKVMNISELKFFIDTFYFGTPCILFVSRNHVILHV